MRSRLIHFVAAVFMVVAFVQCDESVTLTSETNSELSEPNLVVPENNSEQSADVSFDWNEVEAAESYQIQLAGDENFSSIIIDSVAEEAGFEIQNLPYDSTIYWQVRPLEGSQNGPWSATWQFTTMQKPDNADPISTDLNSPSDGAADRPVDVELKWTTVASASAYEVQVASDQNFSSIVVEEEVESTSYQAAELDHQETYYWRVEPVVAQEETEWSEVYDFTTAEENQTVAVTLSSPSDGATNVSLSPNLEWESIDGISEYQVQLATSNSFSSPLVDETVSDVTFDASGLENDQSYYWRVQAANDGDSENWSTIFEFQTESGGSTNPPPSSNGFVGTQGTDFVLDGEVFRFAGTNAYYLPTYEKINSSVVDDAFDAFEEAGINVVRMWGFYDGPPQYGADISLQPEPGVYNETDLQRLDNVVAKAKEHGIKVILTLTNNWPDLGGMPQYNEWDGNAGGGMSHFISDPDTKQWFKDYISMLINRTNTVTGVQYKNEPDIFAWEIIGEARLPGGNAEQLRDWYQEIAQHIKSEDSNHMVATGEEGFDEGAPSEYSVNDYSNIYALRAGLGTSYLLNTAIPEIDYGTAHWYPEVWGLSPSDYTAQHAWMSDHARIAEDLNKPFVLGEWGHDSGYGSNEQIEMYRDFYNHAESIEMDGSLIWQFTAGSTKCYEFGGNICWPGGRQDQTLYNDFRSHIEVMNNSN